MNRPYNGTIYLSTGKTVLIPAATSDPSDPLNLPHWWKILIVVNMSLFSGITLAMISGLGGILQFYAAKTEGSRYNESDLVTLMTYPVITMGIGCLFGLPLSLALGRRVVMIVASVVAVVSIILCATAKTYKWHLSARMALGLAAGQSEVLVPVIVQECFFLHQRSRCLLIQQAVQVAISTTLNLIASPVASALSPEKWYCIGGGLAAAQLALTVFFHPDTLYDRPLSAYYGELDNVAAEPPTIASINAKVPDETVCSEEEKSHVVPSDRNTRLYFARLQTFRHSPRWHLAGIALINMLRSLRSPIIWWAIFINSFALGAVIATTTVYGRILSGGPYHWPESTISYTNAGQVAVALVAIPILGYGSDIFIQWRARRNQGIHEPESRLISAVLVTVIGILSNTLFAEATAYKRSYSSAVFVWCFSATSFYFSGVNIMCFTYFLDTFARSADYRLTVVCAFRTLLSFGLILGLTHFLVEDSYKIAFVIFAVLAAFTGVLTGILYIWGHKFRNWKSL